MTFHKYPKIKKIGTEDTELLLSNPDNWIYIQEKIDGANFRFMPTEDGRIVFGSRNNSIGDTTADIGGNWKRCVNFILDATKDKNLKAFAGCIFYGECCVKHSMNYDWDTIPPFLGFDMWHPEDGFVNEDIARSHYYFLGLPVVPTIWDGYVRDVPELNESFVPKSAYAPMQAEGVVIKNYENQIFAKLVTSKFKEVNKDTFGKGKKHAANDNEKVISMYCTNPRIDKQIFSLVDDGNALDMPLMQWLPNNVWQDIIDEHGAEILHSNFSVDFRQIRKLISKRCSSVLNQVITNNALNGD